MSLNRVCIQGRFTRDPEVRKVGKEGKETSVVAFTLAIERNRNNKDGVKETDFIDCVAWGTTADFIGKYFFKGSAATVDGSLRVRDWKDKEGNNRRNTEVLVEDVFFADSKRKEQSNELAEVQDYLDSELPF